MQEIFSSNEVLKAYPQQDMIEEKSSCTPCVQKSFIENIFCSSSFLLHIPGILSILTEGVTYSLTKKEVKNYRSTTLYFLKRKKYKTDIQVQIRYVKFLYLMPCLRIVLKV